MRPIKLIVIHCSASPNGDSLFRASPGGPGKITPVEIIDGWHKDRGFKRDPAWRSRQNPALAAIGYHFVVYTNSAVVTGRHLGEVGAHVQGHNADSIGICLVGTDKFTSAQFGQLRELITDLRVRYPKACVCGHRDLSPDKNGDGSVTPDEWLKTCPGFDVAGWLAGGMAPLNDHLLENH
jgi:hypothetical protein